MSPIPKTSQDQFLGLDFSYSYTTLALIQEETSLWNKWKNIITYSRKLEHYNGTIIFEIDIIPNQFKTWLFHKFFVCFFCFDLLRSWAELWVQPAGKKCYSGFDSCKKTSCGRQHCWYLPTSRSVHLRPFWYWLVISDCKCLQPSYEWGSFYKERDICPTWQNISCERIILRFIKFLITQTRNWELWWWRKHEFLTQWYPF